MASNKEKQNRSGCLIAIVIIVACVFAAGLIIKSKKTPAAGEQQTQALPVSVVVAQPSTLAPVTTLYGQVTSPSFASLVASVTANVLQVPVLPGQSVDAGQLLVQLDDAEARLALAQAESRALDAAAQHQLEKQRQNSDRAQLKREKELTALAQKSFQRSRDLFAKGLISQSQFDTAQDQYARQASALENRELSIRQHKARLQALEAAAQSAQTAVAQAKLDLSRTTVTAPFAGRIVEVPVAVGDRVRNAQTLATLFNPQALEVRALIPNRYLATVRQALAAGETPMAHIQASVNETISVPLTRLAGAVRAGGGGVDAYFQLPADSSLELNRNIALLLQLPAQEQAIAVPNQAVFGLNAVFIVDQDQRLKRIQVEALGDALSADGGKQVLIRSAEITNGSRILATQLPTAITGLLVAPLNAQPMQ